ncbi:MAG TPA: DUF72 domain-containing protein [Gemmatimonadaceae bacterium]
MRPARTYLGTAGWSLPIAVQPRFPSEGSHLARYAARFSAAEINSSFYRSHRASTYEKWANEVPASFRFSVKVPRTITHLKGLVGANAELDAFLLEVSPLGGRLGCLLVQLPPSLALDRRSANIFFGMLRRRFAGDVAAEPRHATWFTPPGDDLLARHQIARVAADPARVPLAAQPAGWPELVYYRLHGSPRTYYSSYDGPWLRALSEHLLRARGETGRLWCIFDNTASGAATTNALDLAGMVARPRLFRGAPR